MFSTFTNQPLRAWFKIPPQGQAFLRILAYYFSLLSFALSSFSSLLLVFLKSLGVATKTLLNWMNRRLLLPLWRVAVLPFLLLLLRILTALVILIGLLWLLGNLLRLLSMPFKVNFCSSVG